MYKYIVIPGRHHVLSNYMHDYFANIATTKQAKTLNNENVDISDNVEFVWAITSANHENTRRNPLPGYRREAAIEDFTRDIDAINVTYHIKNIATSDRFADYIIKSIEVESRGMVLLNPNNCLVASSTPDVIRQFILLGYKILPIELLDLDTGICISPRAWDLVIDMVQNGNNWQKSEAFSTKIHNSSKNILFKYDLGSHIVELHQDPLVGDEGDITETRDYEKYRASFEDGAARKYKILAPYIEQGRIVDVGCATGSLIKQIDNDNRFIESDFYGIEVAKPLYDYCLQRLNNGDFKNENTFFYQRNIMRGKLFADNTVNTTISISLTHEIDSYLGRESLIEFIQQVYTQTALGGVYLNLDVTGPENPDEIVLLWLNSKDGNDDFNLDITNDTQLDSKEYLSSLSTLGLFKRFVRDFRAIEGDGIKDYKLEQRDGEWYAEIRHADAVEFMVTKDYHASWFSEMHERFCYWSPSVWREQLTKVGFSVDTESKSFNNEWINEYRFNGKVALFKEVDNSLISMPWPDTSILMIARKT